ncbi:hypothetical protein TUM3794_26040 [Shewanella colwelliana]|uniref:DUF1579 domain-containing protein n=1 Tax=Shewanella colwelliana TaxID=23 RepID=A0ABQ4P503_SHECO|nr:hypothetical protein TUM3794_26040 [Shewanella colwelliana]
MLCLLILCVDVFSKPLHAKKIELAPFCQALVGHWQGEASRPQGVPKAITIDAICSADHRQLIISVSEHASHNLSETWWFRQTDFQVELIYFNGVDDDKRQQFSLYQEGEGFSLLGKGMVKQRPALIQLRFDPSDTGWLWLQNVQYLDHDDDGYQLYRALAFTPAGGVKP